MSNVVPIRQPEGWRTPEEIDAQLTARLAEIEEQAESASVLFPCKNCRFVDSFHSHQNP